MFKTITSKFHKPAVLFLEAIAVLVVVFILMTGYAVWRLNTDSLDISFTRDAASQILRDQTGYDVDIESIRLTWPDLQSPLSLRLQQIDLIEDNSAVLTIERMDIGLAAMPLLTGEIRPTDIVLVSPALRMTRSEGNDLSLMLDTGFDTRGNDQILGRILSRMSLLNQTDRAVSLPAETKAEAGEVEAVDATVNLAALKHLAIKDARMIIEDHMLGITWFISAMDISVSPREQGLHLDMSADLPGGRNDAARIDATARYDHKAGATTVSVHFQDFDPRVIARKVPSLSWLEDHQTFIDGTLDFEWGKQWALKKIDVSLATRDARITLPAFYESPVPVKQAVLEGSYDTAEDALVIDKLDMTAYQTALSLSGHAALSRENTLETATLSLNIPAFDYAKIDTIWPDTVEHESLEKWLTRRLSGGQMNDIEINMEIAAVKDAGTKHAEAADSASPAKKQTSTSVSSYTLSDISASFSMQDMSIDYTPPLWPVDKLDGEGRYSDGTLEIDVASAIVRDLAVESGTVKISGLEPGAEGDARLSLDVQGNLTDVFDYIATEPIGIAGEKFGLSRETVNGQAALQIDIGFPVKRGVSRNDISVTAEGTFTDIKLADLVRGMDLAGESVDFTLTDDTVGLKGDARLGGQAITFDWLRYLDSDDAPYMTRVKANAVTDSSFRNRLGIDLAGWVSGPVPADIVYTSYKNRRTSVSVDADLTPSRLTIEPLGYTKLPSASGSLSTTALLEAGTIDELQNLDVTTSELTISGGRLIFQQYNNIPFPVRGEISTIELGDSKIAVEFEQDRPQAPLKLAVTGSFLDARPFLKGDSRGESARKSSKSGQPYIVSVDVGRMRTAPGRLVENAKAYIEISEAGILDQLELDARAGQGDLYLRLKPDEEGALTLQLEAGDAGATLRAFDIYDKIRGGTLIISGKARDPFRNRLISGKAELRDFRVRDAPVLAQLINLISPTGLPRLLAGEGLSFAKLEADFKWQQQPGGDIYFLDNGRTSGASLGLTFEGRVDNSKNKIDISGHVVPVSEVNNLLGKIPLLGDLLAGGRDQAMFAATYKIKGAVDNPEVVVNPLSVLAPGIIRRILFED